MNLVKKIFLIVLTLLIIISLSITLTGCPPAPPEEEAEEATTEEKIEATVTPIAFTSYRDGKREIYIMNANGSGQTRLTNNPAEDDFPDW